MNVSRRVFVTCAALWAAAPLAAQSPWFWTAPESDTLTPFRAFLAQIPASLVSPGPDWIELHFSDLDAVRGIEIGGTSGRPLPLRQLMRAAPMMGRSADIFGANADWQSVTGFRATDLRQFGFIELGRQLGTVMVLTPGTGARVIPSLTARGYQEQSVAGVAALAVGADGSLSLADRNPNDPFRGMLGRGARVQVEGDMVRHASTWPLISALALAGRAPALDDPGVLALLDGLEGLDVGPLITASLMPDAGRLAGGDPFQTVTGRPTPGGPAGWRGLLFADFSTGPVSTGVMVATLPWPDGEPIEPLTEAVAQAWQTAPLRNSTAAERQGAVAIDAARMPSGLVRVRLQQTLPTDVSRAGRPRNDTYEFFLMISREGRYPFLP